MPTYEYHCTKCGDSFSLIMSMSEHDQVNAMLAKHEQPRLAGEKLGCPKCGGYNLEQQYSTFYAKTSRKS